MTGTATTEAEEFAKIYKLEVVEIPTHKSMIRSDHPDMIFKTQSAKYTAVANLVADLHKKGQPILVGTTSIDKNEFLSELLKRKGISHALLNAKNHEKEAEIISHAGEKGAVTVATNMAGRGVDIKLGNNVGKLGGLCVIGTERHESRRIDNQLRGRSGRQGDAGETRFFVSLEDDLMRIFGGDQVSKVMSFLKMPEDVPIEHAMVSKAIEGAQKKVEGHNFDIRKHTVEYDDVMNQQRQIIYGLRKEILETASKKDHALKKQLLEKISTEVSTLVTLHTEDGIEQKKIMDEFASIVPLDQNSIKELEKKVKTFSNADVISKFLTDLAINFYQEREKQVGEDLAREMEVFVYLNTIDTLWIEHLDTIDDLRAGIGLRGYAQRDPLIEYKREAFDLFEKLVATINYEIVHRIFKVAVQGQVPIAAGVDLSKASEVRPEVDISLEQESSDPRPSSSSVIVTPTNVGGGNLENGVTKIKIERGGEVISEQVLDSGGSMHKRKIGRNDPCWCGKTKPDGTSVKYKHCHYPN